MRLGSKRRRPGNGHAELLTFGEAYHDALYGIMLEEIERALSSDKARRDRVRRLTRELLESLVEALR